MANTFTQIYIQFVFAASISSLPAACLPAGQAGQLGKVCRFNVFINILSHWDKNKFNEEQDQSR
jgi:hypothetical protein